MALGDVYVTLAELKAHVGLDAANTAEDTKLTNALKSASRGIDKFCDRQFNQAGSVSARVFYPSTNKKTLVDDFHTTTGLIVKTDEDDDGVFETTWSSSDYQLEPLNGVVDGEPGWPYYRIRAVSAEQRFPTGIERASVRVTADWGWAAVPENVKEACRIVAVETWKLPDAPFGVAGFAEFGVMRIRANPIAKEKLLPYQRYSMFVAKATA